jgi:hypothetical protein
MSIPKDYIVANNHTFDSMCQTCCDYPSGKCVCPPQPSSSVTALTVCSNQKLTVKRGGVVRVLASDLSKAVNNACIRL